MTAEVRARTLTGRHQISDGGQHLVDGVPFGRPYLRQPNRPAVRIPPRKRRRLEDGEEDDETEAIGLLTENGELSEENEVMPSLNGHSVSRSKPKALRKAAKSVQFLQPESGGSDDSDEDDEYDEDFAPGGVDEEEAASEEGSDDDSDSGSGSDAKSETASSASDSSESDTSPVSDSDSDDSDASSPPDILSSKDGSKTRGTTTQPIKHTPPGEGLKATKHRNSRRTRVNRLRYLKALGELPEHATLGDLHDYDARKEGQPAEEPIQTQPFSKSQGKRKRLDEEEPAVSVEEDTTELERRKRELMAMLGETSDTTTPADESIEPSTPVIERAEEESPTEKQAPQRRLRPDTVAIGRILARQAAPFVRKAKVKAVEEPPEPEGASDPDFWKSRINLSAFECWEEEFELSAPPFPFQQHWDPASKLMREKAARKKHKKRRPPPPEANILSSDEEEQEQEQDNVKIVLNYDDAPAINPSSENTDAAIEDQLRNDVATAGQTDLPPLPEDLETLPNLTSSDVKVGAIIISKFFTVNPITITPEISDYKTATVEHEGDSGPGAGTIQLKIAARDLPKKEKKFDSKGNRIYNAADALLMDDDDEAGLWEGMFGELLEAKLLKAA